MFASSASGIGPGPGEVLKWLSDYSRERDDIASDIDRRKKINARLLSQAQDLEDKIKIGEKSLSHLHAMTTAEEEQMDRYRADGAALSAQCAPMMDEIEFSSSLIGLMRSDDPDAVRAIAVDMLGYCDRDLIHDEPEISDLADPVLKHSGSIHISNEDASKLRSVLIHGLLRIGKDGIAGVSYRGKLRIIGVDE